MKKTPFDTLEIYLERIIVFICKWKVMNLACLRIIKNLLYRIVFGIRVMISIEDNVLIKTRTLQNKGKIRAGKNVVIGPSVLLDAEGGMIIGNNVTISRGCMLYTHSHEIKSHLFSENIAKHYQLVIEDEVWIGAKSIILPKVKKIGKGAIIGAGSVVTKEVQPLAIIAGNPAKVIGYRTVNI